MAQIGAAVVTPRPKAGRVFAVGRRVRLSDVSPQGRVRLDAVARYLQDVARDDSADADFAEPMAWVVRRTLIEAANLPRHQEWMEIATWCSGYGGRWAERRTEITGDRGGAVSAVAVWVHVDGRMGTPRRLPAQFYPVWGPSAAGRRVSARLMLPTEPAAGSVRLPWRMRAVDLDMLNHMNNAAHWSALVEAATRLAAPPDAAATTGLGQDSRLRAELEHRAPVGADHRLELWASRLADGAAAWLTVDGVAATAATLRQL